MLKEIIVMGTPVRITCNINDQLERLIYPALQKAGIPDTDYSRWRFTDQDGRKLDTLWPLHELHVSLATTIYLSREAGIAADRTEKTYTREEVQKWRDDIAHAAADMVQRASCGDGDWSWLIDAIRNLAKNSPAVKEALSALPVAEDCASALTAQGVFKGAHGLQGLADAQEFWDQQPYGTRLYYGDGIADYLHRGVLRAAISALQAATSASDRKDAERLDFLDTNAKFQIGWQVNAAPMGNLSITSIIRGGKPIRAAIDAALAAQVREGE